MIWEVCVIFAFCISLGFTSCPADKNEHFSYDNGLPNGPKFWKKEYPQCDGKKQSPVNLALDQIAKDKSLPKLQLKNYDKTIEKATMTNNGHTVNVVPEDGIVRSFQINNSTYELQSFHWHWGQSEHKIYGRSYRMELHLVHKNDQSKLAVIGVLMYGTHTGTGDTMDPVHYALSKIPFKNQKIQLKDFRLSEVIPDGADYYRYEGSLTTPPCTEGVTWTILNKIYIIRLLTVKRFMQLYSTEKKDEACRIKQNYRPIQPLNGRKIQYSKK